jgi:hypothetical protein
VNFATSFGLLLLGVFVPPVLVSGCLRDGRHGVPWYEARRDPTGFAPDPGTTPEAVIQVYAARAVSGGGCSRCTLGSRSSRPVPSAIRGTRCSALA